MPDLPCQHIYARLFIEVRVDYISSVGRRFIPTAPIRRFWLSAKEPIISMHCADRGGLSSYIHRAAKLAMTGQQPFKPLAARRSMGLMPESRLMSEPMTATPTFMRS